MTLKIKLAILIAVIAASGYGGYYIATKNTVVTVDNREAVEKAVEETARRYETQLAEREGDIQEIVTQLKQEVIARLQRDESGGEDSGGSLVYTNDPNSAHVETCRRIGGMRDIDCDSWGVMQFKIPTIIYYYEMLHGETLTEKEAVVLALNDERARQLATKIIFEVEGGVWNWSAAHNDADYYAYQIPFIRSLEKEIINQ